jgi:hypothetical protein
VQKSSDTSLESLFRVQLGQDDKSVVSFEIFKKLIADVVSVQEDFAYVSSSFAEKNIVAYETLFERY